jgi:hypothetical protein
MAQSGPFPPGSLYSPGEAQRTCGQYIVAADTERQTMPGIKPTQTATQEYFVFDALPTGS